MSVLGIEQLRKKLGTLNAKLQKKITRKAIGKALTEEVKAIRAEAPKGKTGKLRKGIGKKLRIKNGVVLAKAGVNVGKKRDKVAPHNHLVALGTADRYTGSRSRRTKTGRKSVATGNKKAYRGKMPSNDFVKRGAARAEGKALSAMTNTLRDEIQKAAKE